MSRCLVVLGMHRSGTSCVTRMLHHLGVYLGENYCTEPMASNLIGHWEARDVVAINDEILSQSGGTWQNVPASLAWNTDCENRMSRLLAQFAARPLFGWKDPRTTITFPAWQRHLPDYALLACVRHPWAVAQSLAVRDGLDLEEGLRLWTIYNQHLLRHVATAKHVFWFPYDQSQAVVHAHLQRLCEHLQLRWNCETAALFNPYLCHNRVDDRELVGTEALSLYEKLVNMSRASLGAQTDAWTPPISVISDSLPDKPLLGEQNIAVSREQTLHEVLRQVNAAQQMQTRRMQALERAAAASLERMAALEERLTRSIEYSTKIEQRLFDLQSRMPSTVIRRWLGRIPGLRPAYHVLRRASATGSARRKGRTIEINEEAESQGGPAELCA
ncbi:MAG TPA: sulfotransferase [Pirellulales bacterium]|nr:sulfotransferase [Pirellulales bacterium]